ncbi:MAG: ATP-dependent metallopeptidase FtsH/Yme1/Tma family protein [Snowella sp.]|nr:ATP-dependent metallopeptidase FtsH/Yme1/Tma family protein [Snowella sp.]
MNDNLNYQSPKQVPDESNRGGIGRNLLILLLWLLFLNLFVFRGAESPLVPYSQFLDQIDANQVSEVQIGTKNN